MENQKEKIVPNFFLLLKQGFKGIFRFRIQFIIILILSFLATLVLTISLSTSRRLGDAYEQVVKKVEPFDIVGTTRVDKTANTNEGGAPLEDFRSVALIDFINNTFVNLESTDFDGEMTNSSSYNFIFNQEAYQNSVTASQNFMTKVVDNQTNTGFYQLTLKYYQDLTTTTDEKAQTKVLRNYRWELKESFASQLIKDLITFRDDRQSTSVAYLQNTSFDYLLRNDTHFFDFIGARFVKAQFYNFNPDEQRFIRYIYWIGAQISLWIANQETTFGTLKEGQNSEDSIFYDEEHETTFTTPEDKTEVFYEFITGKVYGSNAVKQKKFVIGDKSIDPNNPDVGEVTNLAYTLTAIERQARDEVNKGEYLIVEDDNSGQNSSYMLGDSQKTYLLKKGYRGITSPLSIKIGDVRGTGDIYQGIRDVTFTRNFEEFSLIGSSNPTSLMRQLSVEQDFSFDFDIMDSVSDSWNPNSDNNVRASMMQYHIELSALGAGFNVRFRKENIIFDNISSQKFRYIVLNGRDNANFTMLRGTAPTAINEVAISQQYAEANKIHVGDYISLNVTPVMVTGFATDAFTFFPTVDLDFPIPQPKTEAIIYGTSATLTQIKHGHGEGNPGQINNPETFSFFLTNNQKSENQLDLATKKKLFVALQMDVADTLKNSYSYLNNFNRSQIQQQNLVADQVENLPLASYFSLVNFQDSNYHLSWTLLPLVLSVLEIVTYISSLVIAIIAVIALVICIRKTIHFNSKQIGILKAIGTNPWMIAVTYLTYAIVIIGIVVPVAWILGTGLQIPFSLLFTQYFSAPTNIVLVDWISIVIAFFGFGAVAIVTSLVAAYLVTRKPVIEIIDHSVKWSNSKIIDRLKAGIFKNASFNYRFSLTLSSSGKKPIALLVTVVGLTSLLISGAIAIPAIANKVITSYYNSINYANAYDNQTPTVNSPLSKTTLNFWQGNEKWDEDWHDANLKLDSTQTEYGYFLDPEGYMDSASQASPIPRYMFFKDLDVDDTDDLVQNFTYSYAYLLKNPEMFLNLAGSIFGDNYFTVLGQTFNIGTIDQFFGLILNSDYEAIQKLMGDKYNPNLTLDANKQLLAFEFSGSLTLALPQLLGIIFNATSGTTGSASDIKGNDWKRDVIDIILTQAPPYVRGYMEKSNSRQEQFGISFNAEPYVPKKESFVTKITAKTNEHDQVQFIGLDHNQNAFSIRKRDNERLFLNDANLTKIQKIINGQGAEVPAFEANGLKMWDGKTLTLPMLDNHQSAVGFGLGDNGVLSNITTTTRQLNFHTNDGRNPWQVLPKNAWAYNDADFRNSDLYQDPKGTLKLNQFNSEIEEANFNQNYKDFVENNIGYNPENLNRVWVSPYAKSNSSWLDVYALENSRFTYQNVFLDEGQEKLSLNGQGAYFFNDFAFDNNRQIMGSYARPYYQYQNIELFLPTSLIDEHDILKSSNNSSKIENKDNIADSWYYHAKASDPLRLKNEKEVKEEYAVPDSVLNAWGLNRADNPEFLVIRPYDLRYGEKGKETGGLQRLIDGVNYPYWLRYAFDSHLGPGALNFNTEEPVVYGGYHANRDEPNDLKINFQVVGTIDSYDSQLLLIDQIVANMILGYSTARTVGSTNAYLTNPKGPDTGNNQGERPWTDQLNTYEFNKPQLDALVSGVNRQKLASLTYMNNLQDANNYQPLKWHTGKLSNVEEPVNLTSSASFNVRENLGQYSLGLLYTDGLGMTTNIVSQTLLSTQKALINQIYSLAIGVGALLIIAIVITASLLIMLVGDVYIAQYLRFMILMRALGYSNRQIQSYAFGTVSFFSLAVWIAVTIGAWLIIFGIIQAIAASGLAIPYGLSWWPPLVSFAVTFVSFFGSLLMSSAKVRRGEVSDLVNETSE